MGPGDLAQVLRRLRATAIPDDRLIVGVATGDDAAVWRLDERTALVFTTDFFTPIVDNARDWGRIAAANAFSDVYAMGGRPVLALNLVGWPIERLPADLLADVLEGGAAVAAEAGVVIGGGHTIDDVEPKYGMAVIGFADPERLMTNAAAQPGDRLILTKPLGMGVIATAVKRDMCPPGVAAEAVRVMCTLNAAASEALVAAGVRAATDVTGFGLLGHLQAMCAASGTSAALAAGAVPLIEGAAALAAAGAIPGGTKRNRAFIEPHVDWGDTREPLRTLLADAQTSGGLLACCPSGVLPAVAEELSRRGVTWAEVGEITAGKPGRITLSAGPGPDAA